MSYTTNPQDNVRTFYTVEGDGPPLLLFHGTASSSDLWRQLGYVDALKRDYQLILLDMRGHGRSDMPRHQAAYAMEFIVGDIVAVLDDLGLEQAHYFGYSLGGRVGFGIGKYAPERFASLVIGGGSYATAPGWFDRLLFPGALDMIATQGINAFLDAWERRLGVMLPATVRSAYQGNDVKALAAYLRHSDQEASFEDALARMTMPVLLFAGEHDHERIGQSRLAADRLPNATFVTIPDADHLTALLRRDAVLALVTEFLPRPAPAAVALTLPDSQDWN